eukprot:15462244-Alexandrium_andersonii.AAC.1
MLEQQLDGLVADRWWCQAALGARDGGVGARVACGVAVAGCAASLAAVLPTCVDADSAFRRARAFPAGALEEALPLRFDAA